MKLTLILALSSLTLASSAFSKDLNLSCDGLKNKSMKSFQLKIIEIDTIKKNPEQVYPNYAEVEVKFKPVRAGLPAGRAWETEHVLYRTEATIKKFLIGDDNDGLGPLFRLDIDRSPSEKGYTIEFMRDSNIFEVKRGKISKCAVLK